MKTNQDYKKAALASLKGNWAPAVLATIVALFIVAVCTGLPNIGIFRNLSESLSLSLTGGSCLLGILIAGPMAIGVANAFKALRVEGDTNLMENQFSFGFDRYLHNVWTYFLMEVKILLWSLLFIIPGIIKSFAYAMTPLIIVDYPELSASEAMAKSCKMMKGHKFDLFYLYLSFIGWFLLSCITCGIGFFWVFPYVETSVAGFYQDLKDQDEGILDA